MIVYLSLYVVVILFGILADRTKRTNPKLYYFSLFCIILCPSFVAGARDNTIGTDIYFYALRVFEESYNSSVLALPTEDIEPIIQILAGFSRLFSDKFGLFLFLIEAWIMTFTIMALHSLRNRIHFSIAILVLMLIHYNMSLNVMRQMMAIAVLLCSLASLVRGKLAMSLFYWLLSYFCHSTSLIFVVFYVFYWVLNKYSIKKSFFFYIFVLTLIVPFYYVIFQYLLEYLINNNLLKADYVRYLGTDIMNTSLTSKILNGIFCISVCSSVYLKQKKDNIDYLCVINTTIVLLLSFISLGGEIIGRFSLYFTYMNVLLLSAVMYKTKKLPIYILIMNIIMSWSINIYHFNYGETTPYKSKFLNINY